MNKKKDCFARYLIIIVDIEAFAPKHVYGVSSGCPYTCPANVIEHLAFTQRLLLLSLV